MEHLIKESFQTMVLMRLLSSPRNTHVFVVVVVVCMSVKATCM